MSVAVNGTTWGKNDDFRIASADGSVLRKLCRLLNKVESIAIVWLFIASSLTASFVIYAIHLKSFETIIFSDGTELVCVMEGRDASVYARDQFGRKLKNKLFIK
ncbi:MAG: hypothetical protein IKZ87_00790 [Actinomycetaceae bacterium]|nr:hypothetical protein [Actinomycetaceae bacterium]